MVKQTSSGQGKGTVCMSICQSVCLYVSLPVCLSVSLYVLLSVSLSALISTISHQQANMQCCIHTSGFSESFQTIHIHLVLVSH